LIPNFIKDIILFDQVLSKMHLKSC
jgi:hypothetical protein